MEKLIELLNEYEYDIRREKTLRGMTNGCLYYIQSINSYLNLKIISKEYGFIKWLVDNDKIDIDKYREEYSENNLYCNSDFFKLLEYYDIYESLLMTLAISDTPIQDLCAWLK